jgi:hypothetical protein
VLSAKDGKSLDVPSGRAISIQQPFIEEILRGIKKFEYRSRPTKIRGRVYLYASSRVREDGNWKRIGRDPDDVPRAVIVGSVEIVDCVYFPDKQCYGYKLENPKRYESHSKPDNHPQPCFFFPFGAVRSPRKDPKLVKKRRPFTGAVIPSPELAAIVGEQPAPRKYFVKELEKYIVRNRLFTPGNREIIRPDKKLRKVTKKSPFHALELPYFVEKNSKRAA